MYIVGPAGDPFDPFGFAVDPNNNFTYVKLMFVGPNINFTYMKSMFVTQISIFPIQNPYFLGRQILTVGARVWRGRALKYRACAQLLTIHFGGGI